MGDLTLMMKKKATQKTKCNRESLSHLLHAKAKRLKIDVELQKNQRKRNLKKLNTIKKELLLTLPRLSTLFWREWLQNIWVGVYQNLMTGKTPSGIYYGLILVLTQYCSRL
jgi:hypothetical protein